MKYGAYNYIKYNTYEFMGDMMMDKIKYEFDEENEILKVKSKDVSFEIPYKMVHILSHDFTQILLNRKALNPFDDKM